MFSSEFYEACNGIEKETPGQVYFSEFCEIFKNTFFVISTEDTRAASNDFVLLSLLLTLNSFITLIYCFHFYVFEVYLGPSKTSAMEIFYKNSERPIHCFHKNAPSYKIPDTPLYLNMQLPAVIKNGNANTLTNRTIPWEFKNLNR